MTWRKVLLMDERLRFIYEAQLNLWTVTELCKRYVERDVLKRDVVDLLRNFLPIKKI